jgi:hypothetical protein
MRAPWLVFGILLEIAAPRLAWRVLQRPRTCKTAGLDTSFSWSYHSSDPILSFVGYVAANRTRAIPCSTNMVAGLWPRVQPKPHWPKRRDGRQVIVVPRLLSESLPFVQLGVAMSREGQRRMRESRLPIERCWPHFVFVCNRQG